MTRTKNNPKLSHDQWLLVQKEQIKMITKLQEDKDELKSRVKELEEALKKNEEVKEENEKMKKKVEELEEELKRNEEVKEQNEQMKKKVKELEEEICERCGEVEVFLEQKVRKVLITGDSHMKCISTERLKSDTKTNVTFAKTYCSRVNYPGSKFPKVAISNVLQSKVDQETTHLVMTAPTSDLTNLSEMDQNAKQAWADLSARTLVLIAEWCLIHYSSLQQVVIMDHLPR